MCIYIYTIDRKIERNTGPSHAQHVVCCSRTSRSRSTWHALSQSIDIGLLYTVYNVKYVHMFICIYFMVYIYIYIHIYIYARTYIHMNLWLNIQMHTNEVISDCPQPSFRIALNKSTLQDPNSLVSRPASSVADQPNTSSEGWTTHFMMSIIAM
jgi:hypothetical protein